jgi:FAD/FMN-containing dehydrogenase
MNNFSSKVLVFYILIGVTLAGYQYSLPSDPNWPSNNAFQLLKANVKGKVMLRGDVDYNPHTWNKVTNVPKPAAIVQPSNNQDVITALKFARDNNIRISVQSTGHHQDHRNIFDNSIHIDMSSMNFKSIDLKGKTITLGTGNNFSQIQAYVAQQSNRQLVVACGADPGVGICKLD